MATPSCPAEITTDANGAVYCTDGMGTAVAWEASIPFDPGTWTAEEWATPFSWGWGVVVTFWLMAWGLGVILRAIRQL